MDIQTQKSINEIPESHQKLVMERFYEAQENPESLLDWDEIKKSLLSKYL